MTPNKITVIIPTRNEASGIGLTIEEIRTVLGNVEIIVTDTNSTDATPEIAARLGAKVLVQKSLGKGRGIAHGLQHVDRGTAWLVLIDGDYSLPAYYLKSMIKIIEKRLDVGLVSGAHWRASMEPRSFCAHLRRLLTHPYYLLHHVLTVTHRLLNGVIMEDPLAGFRVIRYDCIKHFDPAAKGFDIEVEINNYIVKKGYNIIEVPFIERPRLGKPKFFRPKHVPIILSRMIIMRLSIARDHSSFNVKALVCCC